MDVPEVRVDWRSKGFWLPDETLTAAELAADKPSIFGGRFTWPLLVLRRDAAEANIATMAAYCRRHGLDFAPHAKTTMAPALLDAQLAAGAWGMTVATGTPSSSAANAGASVRMSATTTSGRNEATSGRVEPVARTTAS